MRTFYKQILDRTYEIFGARQTENMEEDQIVFLLNALENVSKMYAYIPEEQQKAIINKRMITDKDYKNINVRLIASWFEQDGKIFYKEVSQLPNEPTAKPLEGEAREKAINEYLAAIAKAELNFTQATTEVKGNGAKMREQLESNGIVNPPTHFCLKTNICKVQCERCKSEQEIYGTPNKEGSEGTGQNPEVPTNESNSINQDNGI